VIIVVTCFPLVVVLTIVAVLDEVTSDFLVVKEAVESLW
jgi:hypothetical protein